jgi:transposase
MDSSTRYYSSTEKHRILTQYRLRERGAGFASLAKNFSIQGGERTIRRWYAQWDGTPSSLKQQPRSGRPPILTQREINQHIAAPIRRSNRKPQAIHYTDIHATVQEKTGKKMSLRTIQSYGKEKLQAKKKSTNKRTHSESKLTNI